MNVSVESRIVALRFADAPDDLVRLQRCRMADDLDAQQQRHQRADRQSEAVKRRKRIEQNVRLVQREMRAHLLDIRRADCMCESATPLGSPSVPDVNRITAGVECIASRRDEARHEGADGREDLVDERQLLANVFEIDDLAGLAELVDQRVELAELDEAVRGDDALDLARS